MGKSIIISEKTFNSLIRGTLNEAFAKMGRGRTSAATKLADVLESNRILMQNGLSLFKDTAINELPEIVADCTNNPKLLNIVLEDEDNEIFTDQQAKDFVLYRVKGIPMKGENIYWEKLSEIAKSESSLRRSGSDSSKSESDKIISQRANAKAGRENDFIKSIKTGDEGDPAIEKVCSRYPSTSYKGGTVYMFVKTSGELGEKERTNVRQLRTTLKNIGYMLGPATLHKDRERKLAYIYFNVEKGLNEGVGIGLLSEAQVKIDNFDKVAKLLQFQGNPGDEFYFVQIIKRFKDNPNDDKSQGNYSSGAWYLKSWRIHSAQELMQLKPEIIKWCENNNARAYITINTRNTKETDDYIKVMKQKLGPGAKNVEDRVAGVAKDGDNWKGQRVRLFLDIDTPDKRIWDEVKYILNMCGIQILDEYVTPSGGLHIILPNKEERNLYYAKKLFMKFDDWKDKKMLATVHANVDGKIILYSNVNTKGY